MDDMEGDGVPCPLVDATEAVLCKARVCVYVSTVCHTLHYDFNFNTHTQILSHLNVQDLCSMAQTCKRVHALITTSDATTAIWYGWMFTVFSAVLDIV